MEEQIKALIEKYEGDYKEVETTTGSWKAKLLLICLIQDLKQLLTTSQGNPDMV